jgi:hypothetical protein
MKPKAKRGPVKVYGRGAMKPEPRGPNFIFSADLQAACLSLFGRSSEAMIARMMRDKKSRARLRGEQLRLASQKARSANEAPASGDAGETPAPSSGGFSPLDMKESQES